MVRNGRIHGGLIPAWAGKTAQVGMEPPGGAAHPRVGGENLIGAGKSLIQGGSSPRGRGKRSRSPSRFPRPRLIPAWAGKTSKPPWPSLSNGAHPRVGGENLEQSPGAIEAVGSSPRGRGKPH